MFCLKSDPLDNQFQLTVNHTLRVYNAYFQSEYPQAPNSGLPQALQRLYPSIESLDHLQELCQIPEFLYSSVFLCSLCHSHLKDLEETDKVSKYLSEVELRHSSSEVNIFSQDLFNPGKHDLPKSEVKVEKGEHKSYQNHRILKQRP